MVGGTSYARMVRVHKDMKLGAFSRMGPKKWLAHFAENHPPTAANLRQEAVVQRRRNNWSRS